ncbi:TonB protein [Candidatus Hepatincola sp. Pdp]
MYKLKTLSARYLLLAILLHCLILGLIFSQYIRNNLYINPAIEVQLLPYAPNSHAVKGEKFIKKNSLIKKTETINKIAKEKNPRIKTINNIAKYLDANTNNSPIVYPLIAKQQKQEGTLILLLQINKWGSVQKILVEKSSGSAILDSAALQTVSNWHFKAFQEYENTLLRLPIIFMLNE